MRSRLQPLFSLVTVTLLLAVTSPLPMAANPLGDRDTTVQYANPNQEARTERRLREQRIQQSQEAKAELLSQQGSQEYHNRKYQEALRTYQQVLAIRREMVDKAGVASALHNIGTIYSRIKQNDQAREFLQQALTIRRKIGDKAGEERTLYNIEAIGDKDYLLEPIVLNGGTDGRIEDFPASGKGEVSLLFEDDEKQATPPFRPARRPVGSPSGQKDIIPDPPRPTSPSGSINSVPSAPANVAQPSGDRDIMNGW